MTSPRLSTMLALGYLALLLLRVLAMGDVLPPRPPGFPAIKVPADNPISHARVDLGRRLFYDRRLSVNGTIACADCHLQQHGFADPRAKSLGALGEPTRRNAMTLTNVAYNARQTWADDRVTSLEEQARIPLTLEHPVEMGFHLAAEKILAALRADAGLAREFAHAFPGVIEPLSLANIVLAIASFERVLVSARSDYDRYWAGDEDALSAAARRGLALFNSSRLRCAECHAGYNFRFTRGHRQNDEDQTVAYHNIGLYDVDGQGAYPTADQGLFEVTGKMADMGRFKAPTLRNVEVTAPYMHDGSIATLEEVIDVFARGGRLITDGPDAGDGRQSPLKSPLVTGFEISAAEKQDLLAFLRSLTDRGFLADPALGPPRDND